VHDMTVVVPNDLLICINHDVKTTLYKLQKIDPAPVRGKYRGNLS